ncbi:M23 family metallopeptidase [Nonomuraea sp. NPDC050691]|uniref:M23 family metallopeptidase n=1 Tax=Nonomuraea sp. NPDC050691 TaxID=3155661 RepID=UPI0033D283FC
MPTPRLPLRTSRRIRCRAPLTLILLTVVVLVPLLPASPATADPAVWRWPVEGRVRIARPFAPPLERWLAGHRGIDLAAPPGTPVLAAGAGTVRYAGRLAGRGVVSIEHPGGLRTTYLPVALSVRRGQRVSPGDRLGTLEEPTGHCEGSCLHWGLLRPPRYLDPLLLLGRARIRLLPFWTPEPEPGPLYGPPSVPSGESLASLGVEPEGTPSDPLITMAPASPPAASPWTTTTHPTTPPALPEPPSVRETHGIVPPGYGAQAAQHPTTPTMGSRRAAPNPGVMANAEPVLHGWADDHTHPQGHHGTPGRGLLLQSHGIAPGGAPRQVRDRAVERDHDPGRDDDEIRSHDSARGLNVDRSLDVTRGLNVKPSLDAAQGLSAKPSLAAAQGLNVERSDADAAVRPGNPTSDTWTLPLEHPSLLLAALTSPPSPPSPPPCASPSATPRTPSSASSVWSLRFPHGPAAAPAAGALGTATLLAGLLLVVLLRHRKPHTRRVKPKPRSRTVRGAHRKHPRPPGNGPEERGNPASQRAAPWPTANPPTA